MNRAYSKFSIKSVDDETGLIVGIASTPEVDRMGDVVEPEGAQFSLPLPLLAHHDHSQPVGAVIEAKATPEGIRIVARLALDASERVREVWALVKAGALRGLSIGFMPLKQSPIAGGGYRFSVWEWHELSIVAVPANASATIANIKSYSAKPVSALRINTTKSKGSNMTIPERTVRAESVSSAAFVQWYTRAKAVAAMQGTSFLSILDEIGAPVGIAEKIKATAETTVSQPGLAGSSTEIAAFISQAAETSVLLRMIADRAVYQVPLRAAVYLPDADVTAAVVGEGQPFPVQGFSLNRTRIDSFKVAGGFVATDELIRDISPAGQAFLNSQLRAAVANAADTEMFSRMTNSGTLVETTTGAGAEDVLVSVGAALSAVIQRATDRPYFAVSPAAAAWLAALEGMPENCDVFGGRFLNRPCVITDALSGLRIAVVNGQAVAGHVDRVDITASGSATVDMADSPATGATTQVSMFQTNSAAVKVVSHLAIEPIREDGLAFVDISLPSGA